MVDSLQLQSVKASIAHTLGGFKSSGLKEVPGMYFTMFAPPGQLDTVPAYIIPMRNTAGHIFQMPDWVRHDGLPNGGGCQNFPHDVMHMLENNVLQNVASPKWGRCWSELHKQGTPDSRWRSGKAGPAGILEGKTLFICAPGPSLKQKIPEIEAARAADPENVKVMAINRAVRGIRADYVVFIERWVPVEWRDEKVQELQKGATLIACPQTDFKAVRDWPNPDVYWGFFNLGRYGNDKRINWLASLDPMASTTAACAVRVGYELGASKLILCGMDFCCEAEIALDKAPIQQDFLGESMATLKLMSEAVSQGHGKKDNVKALADRVLAYDKRLDEEGWIPQWKATNFYFDDVHIRDTPYINDARFSAWNPIRNMKGGPVQTTAEFLSYSEQLRAVCAVVESGSDCIIINGSPEGILNWHPMSIEKALAYKPAPPVAAPAPIEATTQLVGVTP